MGTQGEGASPQAVRYSRMLIFSKLCSSSPMWQGVQYRIEDVVATLTDARMIFSRPQRAPMPSSLSRCVVNDGKRRLGVAPRTPLWVGSRMGPTAVGTPHDLFCAAFRCPHEVAHLHRLKGWREQVRRARCLTIQPRNWEVQESADYLRVLADFDEVDGRNPGPVPEIAALCRPAPTFMGPAVDAPRGPCPAAGAACPRRLRTRAPQRPHRARPCSASWKNGLSSLYETRGDSVVRERREHRALQSNLIQRSKLLRFRVTDSPERHARTGGDEVQSARFLERVAGGAVLLGSRARTPEFEAAFDWPDVVIPVALDEADMAGVLADLSPEPDRLAAVRTEIAKNRPRGHDWLARWSHVPCSNELPPLAQLQQRISGLKARADKVDLPAEGRTPARRCADQELIG